MISSFSKKELERLHLTRSSLEQNLSQVQLVYYKFLAENFGQRIADKKLQQNLPTDQQQLQNSNLVQTNFQQLSFEQHIYKETILNNELATNLENKKSLAEDLSFQSFFFDNLAFQKNFLASGKLVEKNFYKKQLVDSSFPQTEKEACKEQLLPTCFPAARENKQLYSSLAQQSVAKAASHQELSPAYSQRATGQKELLHRELPEAQLEDRTSARTLCRNQLAEKNFHHNSFYHNSVLEETFTKTASQQAA